MASSLSIVIPWQDRGEEDRRRAFEYTVAYYKMMGIEVVIGEDGHSGPLNRSKLRNAGAHRASGHVLAFIDADTLIPFQQIYDAAKVAQETGRVVLPYNIGCTYLTADQTERFYQAGPMVDWAQLGVDPMTNWSYIGPDGQIPEDLLVGPACVTTRASYIRVGGFHEGFVGWGEEERDFLYRTSRLFGVDAVHGGSLGLYHRTSNPEHQPAYRQGTEEQKLFLANRRLFLQRREADASEHPSITCPACKRTSHHPTDIAEGWCSNCQDYTSRPSDIERAARRAGAHE